MSEAQEQFQAGLDLKAKGQLDAALTMFRRAAIADPTFFEAHLESAVICRDKARRDPMYKRPAFEAFRQAARLRVDDEKAHDGYIVAAQESGKLEELLFEYGELRAKHPENANFQRCYKNISTLTLAMVPEHAPEKPAGRGNTLGKKFLYFLAVNLFISGLASVFSPVLFAKVGLMNADMAGGAMMGLAMMAGGAMLWVVARRQK